MTDRITLADALRQPLKPKQPRDVLLDRLVEIRTAMLRSHGGKEGLTEAERRNVIELVDQLRSDVKAGAVRT